MMLMRNDELIVVGVAHFKIGIRFKRTDQVIMRSVVDNSFKEMLDGGGFLIKNSMGDDNFDFEIIYGRDIEKSKVIIKNNVHYAWAYEKKAKKYYVSSALSLEYFMFVFKLAICDLLKANNGFILHASSVISSDTRLKVFIGESGAGKSTTASSLELYDNALRVGDDLIGVTKNKDVWTVFSLPIIEKDIKPVKYEFPIERVDFFIINKSQNSEIKKLILSVAFKQLLSQVWTSDGNINKAIASLISDMVKFARVRNLFIMKNDKQLNRVINES